LSGHLAFWAPSSWPSHKPASLDEGQGRGSYNPEMDHTPRYLQSQTGMTACKKAGWHGQSRDHTRGTAVAQGSPAAVTDHGTGRSLILVCTQASWFHFDSPVLDLLTIVLYLSPCLSGQVIFCALKSHMGWAVTQQEALRAIPTQHHKAKAIYLLSTFQATVVTQCGLYIKVFFPL
jgi:hypothetical protein